MVAQTLCVEQGRLEENCSDSCEKSNECCPQEVILSTLSEQTPSPESACGSFIVPGFIRQLIITAAGHSSTLVLITILSTEGLVVHHISALLESVPASPSTTLSKPGVAIVVIATTATTAEYSSGVMALARPTVDLQDMLGHRSRPVSIQPRMR
jgi:hypothetical protein